MRDLSQASREDLLALNAQWEQAFARQQEQITVLQQENARLRARIEEMEARLGQDSANSSRPPSADPPHRPPRQRGNPSGRRPGGQPGHPAHQRSLVPLEGVDRLVEHWPVACACCGQALAAGGAAGEPVRHQVTELPLVRAEVTEHRLHQVCCPRCGRTTRAALPAAVPRGAFGPRLQAVVTVLSGRYRLSRREVAGVCADLLGVPLAVGSVDSLCRATGQALAGPVQEVQAAVRTAPVVNVDETGWRQAGERGGDPVHHCPQPRPTGAGGPAGGALRRRVGQ
jgi:transposase